MPRDLEMKWAREADEKGLRGEERRAYVYGGMRKTGWRPKREEEAERRRKRQMEIEGLFKK